MEGDALKMVYEAEKNAEELLKNAEAEAQQILLEAKEKAKEMDISGAVKMKREVQNILIEAKLNARAATKSLIEDGMQGKKIVLSVGENAINKAVEMVKERVVN